MANSTQPVDQQKTWLVRDPVHGDIALPDWVRPVIAEPLFQRLRYIRQTGLLYLVFPGAQHSRFEHSIGAAHLANSIFNAITRSRGHNMDITVPGGVTLAFSETEKTLAKIRSAEAHWHRRFVLAALLHDVGHGPLSHTFEKMQLLDAASFAPSERRQPRLKVARLLPDYLLPRIESKRLHHEDITVLYIERIMRLQSMRGDLQLFADWPIIAALAASEFREFIEKHELLPADDVAAIRLLAPFVAGTFDVDRTDYLARDSMMAGVSYGRVEGARVLRGLSPVLLRDSKGQPSCGLVARARDVHALDHFLVCLYEMYTQVYNHPVVVALEHELVKLAKGSRQAWDAKWYETASDMGLFFGLGERSERARKLVWRFLHRELKPDPPGDKTVLQVLGRTSSELEGFAVDGQYERLEPVQRQLIKPKEQTQVWLRAPGGPKAGAPANFSNWRDVSLVASRLTDWKFSPEIWWRNTAVTEAVSELFDETVASDRGKSRVRSPSGRKVVSKRGQK